MAIDDSHDVERPLEIHLLSTVFLHDDVTRSSPVVKIHGGGRP